MTALTIHRNIGYGPQATCFRPGLITAGLAAWLFASSVSVAQGGAGEADRTEHEPVDPITIDGTMPSPAGEFSLGLTANYECAEGIMFAHLPAVSLNAGLRDFFDVEVEVPFVYTSAGSSAFGLGDVNAIVKWLVVKERMRLPALVLGLEAVFPTGSIRRGWGEGDYEFRPFLAALKMFGPLTLQGNLGWSRVLASHSGEHGGIILGGISIAMPLWRIRCARRLPSHSATRSAGREENYQHTDQTFAALERETAEIYLALAAFTPA